MEVASGLREAPHWPESAYLAAVDPGARPARVALVADDADDGMAGFVVAVLVPPQAELETIAVVSGRQRQGIGALLLSSLFTALKQRHITEVMLEVRESNRAARAFYTSAGFAETGRRKGYYSDPEEDAILLERRLGLKT
jgi:ribosomal-protein-alanine acetyltransferase